MMKICKYSFLVLMVVSLFLACKKEDYIDTGIHEAKFNGTIWNYLESRPELFDTLMVALKIAGLDDVLKKDEVTFFAPADPCILKSVWTLNKELFLSGQDSVKRFDQISPGVWRKYLSRYIFKGKYVAKDFRQIDTLNLAAFSGGVYKNLEGIDMNIGVLYNDIVSKNDQSENKQVIKYAGYRQLYLNYPYSFAIPEEIKDFIIPYITAPVATSDIQPTNGVLHVLQFSKHIFGFENYGFVNDAYLAGISPE
ncbi:hypothetical protein AB3466_01400 [Sphingobacterium thalpophilum]|uniref:hypothetical protein n=1 Tax=Sphingobacterium thalpophilum TaxID=259 RepID=UPI0037DA0E32